MTAPFSFVQITDTHIGITTAEALKADLREIEAQVGEEVSFIAVTGDLTDSGTEQQYLDYLEGMRSISLKSYPVPGNHDYIDGTFDKLSGGEARYERLIAPLNYSFDHGGVHFVAYDCIPGGDYADPTPWLLEDLGKLPIGTPVIILVHYPMDDHFYRQLAAFNIVATISGHWHASRTFDDGKILHFNSPPVSFGGIDFSSRCYRVFTWDGQRLTVRTVPLKRQFAAPRSEAKDLKVLWTAPLNGNVMLCAPLVRDGRVFVSLMNEDNERQKGGVGCWDAATGRLLWRTGLAASVKNSPFHSGDAVFVVTVIGQVVALDAGTGEIRWDHQLRNPSARWIFSSVAGHDGRVYAGHGSCFTALDMVTGKRLFEREDLTSADWLSSYSSPVVSGNRIFIGFFFQGYYCLDALTGQTLWQLEGNDFDSRPALDDHGRLYLSGQGGINKLDAATGEILWKSPTAAGWSPVNPLYHDKTVYVPGDKGTKFLAVDAADGREKWRWEGDIALNDMLPYQRDKPGILNSPQVMGREIVIGSNDGRLIGLDQATGVPVWSHQFEVAVSTTPAIEGDTIYLPLSDGRLYALRRR